MICLDTNYFEPARILALQGTTILFSPLLQNILHTTVSLLLELMKIVVSLYHLSKIIFIITGAFCLRSLPSLRPTYSNWHLTPGIGAQQNTLCTCEDYF